ncbi:hypothetical protein G7046_g9037 [Stylonectria norvegica]|nr:hypothetical protein G7046_g9037 [Stylonectria norvegica]
MLEVAAVRAKYEARWLLGRDDEGVGEAEAEAMRGNGRQGKTSRVETRRDRILPNEGGCDEGTSLSRAKERGGSASMKRLMMETRREGLDGSDGKDGWKSGPAPEVEGEKMELINGSFWDGAQ